jgi:hypothetical protein
MRGYDSANALRELCISVTRMRHTLHSYTLFPTSGFFELPRGQASSVGSSLRVLRLLNLSVGCYIWKYMTPARLRSLSLEEIGAGAHGWTELEEGIERWTALRELHLEEMDPDAVSSHVIQFLLDRKTIQCVSVGKYNSAAPFDRHWGPLKLVFGMSAMQTMLAKPRLDYRNQSTVDSGTDVWLFPTLFCVAKQAPVSGTSSVLIGLLELKNEIAGSSQRAAKRTGIREKSAKRRREE